MTAAVAIAGILSLAACGGDNSTDSASDGPVTLDVTMSESFILPWVVGQEQGFFEERDVIVENLTFGSGGSTTLRQQIAGGSPVGDVSYGAALDAVEQGAELQIVSSAVQSPDGADYWAMKDDESVNSLADVERWGVTNPGSVTEGVAMLIAEREGVMDDVEIVYTGGIGEGIALLEAGDIDITFADPVVAAQFADTLKPVVLAKDYLEAYQTSVITVDQAYAEDNPEVVTAIIEGFAEAVEWIYANPEEAAAIYAEAADISREAALSIVEVNTEETHWATGFNTEALENAEEALVLTMGREEIDYCSVLTAEYLPEGMPKGPLEDC